MRARGLIIELLGTPMNQKKSLIEILEGEDDLGVVIRSHIVVEQYLNHLIESMMVSPKHYQNIKIDYSDKVRLAISLGLNPRFETPLNTLGTIRNGFAHKLRSELSKQDVNSLYKSMSKEDKEVVQSCFNKTRAKLPEENIPDHSALEVKEKFTLYIVAIAGALQVACNQHITSKSSGTPQAARLI